jgi:1-acyl-sn-glycerol-3-phosphate acyltransferase
MFPNIPKLVRGLLAVFFRRIEIEGLENVPAQGGGLLVAWHPNGLIDPGLVLGTFPRRVVFGARHGLFKWPGLGWMMRSLGTVPLYRSKDARPGDDPAKFRAANRKGLEALAGAVRDGSFSALFPEGLSHDESHPMPLRSGAARLYYQAVGGSESGRRPVILPVGIHYDRKRLFRSRALVVFHPPLELPVELATPKEDPDEYRAQVNKLTELLDQVLDKTVLATESWDLHHYMHRARALLRAERAQRAGATPGPTDLREQVLGFSRLWTGYRARRESHPEETSLMLQRVIRYDEDMRAVGLADHHLDAPPQLTSPWSSMLLILLAILVFLVLPAFLLIGYLINLPTALLIVLAAQRAAAKKKDEASIKLLVGIVAFPLTWTVVAVLVAWGESRLAALYPAIPNRPFVTAALVIALSAFGGFIALIYHPLASELLRSIRVRLTLKRSHRTVKRLLEERASLHDALLAMAEGLALPGEVAEDGRIVSGG